MNNLWCTNYSSVRTNTRFTKNVLGHFAATEVCKQPCINFSSSCSSEMSICSSLVAVMALSFSSPLMKIICFSSTGFNPFLL